MLHQKEILQNNLDANFSRFFIKEHSVPPQSRNVALPVYGEEEEACKPEEDMEKTEAPIWQKWVSHLHG